MNYKKVLSMLFLITLSAPLYSMDDGGEGPATPPPTDPSDTRSVDERIEAIKTLLAHIDHENEGLLQTIQGWANKTAIPAAILSFIATFRRVRSALPDRNDVIIPSVIAAGVGYASYKLTPRASSCLLSQGPIATRVAPQTYRDNTDRFTQDLQREQESMRHLNLPDQQLLELATREQANPGVRQLLLDCRQQPQDDPR